MTNTTPEPWEEEFENIWVKMEAYCASHATKSQHDSLLSFIRQQRTAAYEQGKRERRNNLLTALKAVLGEKKPESISLGTSRGSHHNRGHNELHDRLTRFIKEQEDNQDKHG